jgi:hypothetical protein
MMDDERWMIKEYRARARARKEARWLNRWQMTEGRLPATCHPGLPPATRNGFMALKGRPEAG